MRGICRWTAPAAHAHVAVSGVPPKSVFNTTNLHTHGLHVSPKCNSDNVFVDIQPGCGFSFEFKIPKSHPAGTYWYHPHVHGSTAVQVSSGAEGALIIRGDFDQVPPVRRQRSDREAADALRDVRRRLRAPLPHPRP